VARLSLVLDASVVMKWYSPSGESGVQQAVDILEKITRVEISIYVPELLYYEVANALTCKTTYSQEKVQTAISNLYTLDLRVVPVEPAIMGHAIQLARQHKITVYDACYIAVAASNKCPLVTANPRHQRQGLGCEVIPLEQWKG
jgi:predicted nucleic acid-binding protein